MVKEKYYTIMETFPTIVDIFTHQKSKKPLWRHKDDVTEERMWWAIDWALNWGRDKSY